MRRLSALVLVATALFSTALSTAAGGVATTVGSVFATLGLVAWLTAFLLDLAYEEMD